jgi:ribonucleoside-diphosphate reductase beta chain
VPGWKRFRDAIKNTWTVEIEGLFFYGAFAYVYFLRSRGLLHGLASGTNWVFQDESMHMAFAFDVVDTVRREEPGLFDDRMAGQVREMLAEAVDCETQFAADLLGQGVPGLSLADMREYLRHVADRRLGIEPLYGAKNPLAFMELQDARSCRTSSSAGCRPTRSACRAPSPSPMTSER